MLIPNSLHSCFHFYCTPISDFTVFSDSGYTILDFLNGKDVTPELKEGNEGGSERLDVWFNKAESLAYAQLHTYSNYSYVPETEIVELSGKKAATLISRLA